MSSVITSCQQSVWRWCTPQQVCPTGRYWGCYPLRPDAGTQECHSQTPPPSPGRPPFRDSKWASFCGQTLESGAPDTSGSCGRDPAGAAGSSLWKSTGAENVYSQLFKTLKLLSTIINDQHIKLLIKCFWKDQISSQVSKANATVKDWFI